MADAGKITVTYLFSGGDGFTKTIRVPEGTRVEEFIESREELANMKSLSITVNRRPVSRREVLQDGALISVAPTKFDGN